MGYIIVNLFCSVWYFLYLCGMKVTDLQIIEACSKAITMAEAARSLQIDYKTLRNRALKLECFVPNKSGKGTNKPNSKKLPIEEVFNSKIYNSNRLRKRLINESIKKHKCECCNNTMWLNNPIPLELHHIDGDNTNNKLENLQVLCPNCHTMTDNYRGKNIGKTKIIESASGTTTTCTLEAY